MNLLDLTRRLTLEAPERVADGAGGFTASWTVRGSLWAAMAARSGRGKAAAVGAPLTRVLWTVTVRSAPVGAAARPVAGQRFREGERQFRILAVSERAGSGRWLDCLAEEERAA